MIQLPNQCYCSEFSISPKNWNSPKASVKKPWRISYRFYDPLFKANPKYKYGKLVVIKRMNQFQTLEERQQNIIMILKQELVKLKTNAYNPISGSGTNEKLAIYEIMPLTPFLEALNKTEQRLKGTYSTKRDLKSILRFVEPAAYELRIHELPVSSIGRKHIKLLLDQIEKKQNQPSPHRYNKIRTNLMMLFKELLELEAVDYNPVKEIAKKKGVIRLRKLLPDDKRKKVNDHLKANQYRFWLFMHIFFHSGARLTEMMQIRKFDVDLERQFFTVTIRKGQLLKEVEKPIKHIALPYWKEAIDNALENDYIFSRNLLPGPEPIQSFQITKRWNKYVKKELGITEDFYSLKHLNLDETAAILDIQAAATQASHTSTDITTRHYTVNEAKRQIERLKGVGNEFI